MSDEYQQEEDQEELAEDMRDLQESQLDQYDATYPTPKADSSLFGLFWKVSKAKDATKFANLNKKDELGMLNISVRDAQKLALLGDTFHHIGYGTYWWMNGEIINRTSMAKDGWFTELFVSQKKFTTRSKKSHSSEATKEKWRLFKKPNIPEEG